MPRLNKKVRGEIKLKRKRCKDCQDFGHGCFGAAKRGGWGYEWCLTDKPRRPPYAALKQAVKGGLNE